MKNKSLLYFYLLSITTYFTQGIEGIPSQSLFFYMKETLNFDESKIMYIGTITGIAWLIKPIWGFLTDNYFTKKTWIYISLFGSLLICIYLGVSPFLYLPLLIAILSFGSFNTALRDVAVDGVSCIEGKATETTGNIQALQWISITVASILVGLGGGYIAEHYNYQIGFLVLIPIYLIMGIVVVLYKPTTCRDCSNCKNAPTCQQLIFEPSILVTNCPNHNMIIETSASFISTIKAYKKLFTNKTFLFTCLFLFLYKYSPSFGTPLAFIERDVFGWSKMWMGTLGAIVSCFEILGAIGFYKYNKYIKLHKYLTISVWLGALTSLAYLYFTPQTAIIYGICFSVIGMFVHLMVMAFMAKSTIKGFEATSFALLCSISNLAGTCSSLSGAWLYPKMGLTPLIILSALTSFLCLPLIKKIKE